MLLEKGPHIYAYLVCHRIKSLDLSISVATELFQRRNVMFNALKEINARPKPFEFYTASELWTNEHTVQRMLVYHLVLIHCKPSKKTWTFRK